MAVTEPYRSLGTLRVGDAMHPGLISCSPDTPLRAVARMMATYRVHAVLVLEHGDGNVPRGAVWGIVTDTELLVAARDGDLDEQASHVLAARALAVSPDQELADAARLLLEHQLSHVVVVEPHTGRPVGVLSTLDVARAIARFPETHPVR